MIILVIGILFEPGLALSQTPSLDLEGTAALAPTGTCTKTQCSGSLSGSLSGSPIGVSAASLSLNLSLDLSQGFGGCYPTSGSGTVGENYDIAINGKLCPAYDHFNLSAHAEINSSDLCGAPWQAMAGQLNAFGQIHTAGPTPVPPKGHRGHAVNPIAPVDQAVIAIVGTASQLPAPCPSP